MRFIEREQEDESIIVQHWSDNRFLQIITESHRLWPKYQASSNVTNVPYVTPPVRPPLTDEEILSGQDMNGTRLGDWLIDALITKGTIVIEDLSSAAQAIYGDRKILRGLG